MEPMRLEPYWTPQDIADALKKDPSTVRRWIDAGVIPAVDVGENRTSYRVADSDFRAFLAARKVPPVQS